MADHFLGALKEIERRAQNNILIFSDVLSERLDVIAKNMVLKPVSDNDYLKLLELYYKKFSKEENKQGMLFCLLRMQQIVYLKGHRKKQNEIINLEYSEGYDSVTEAFLTRKRDYYKNTLKNVKVLAKKGGEKKRKEKSPEALLTPRGKGYSLSLYKSYGVIWYT